MSHELFTLSGNDEVQIIELTLPLNLDASQFDHLNETLGQLVNATPDKRWVVDLASPGLRRMMTSRKQWGRI